MILSYEVLVDKFQERFWSSWGGYIECRATYSLILHCSTNHLFAISFQPQLVFLIVDLVANFEPPSWKRNIFINWGGTLFAAALRIGQDVEVVSSSVERVKRFGRESIHLFWLWRLFILHLGITLCGGMLSTDEGLAGIPSDANFQVSSIRIPQAPEPGGRSQNENHVSNTC